MQGERTTVTALTPILLPLRTHKLNIRVAIASKSNWMFSLCKQFGSQSTTNIVYSSCSIFLNCSCWIVVFLFLSFPSAIWKRLDLPFGCFNCTFFDLWFADVSIFCITFLCMWLKRREKQRNWQFIYILSAIE